MTTKEHLTKHDREIAAIRKLILQGMKMINRLAASQRKTDEQLQGFIRAMRGGANGHSKRKIQ